MKLKPTLVFQPSRKVAEFDPAQTILEAAQNAGIGLSSSCGGVGSCGTCRVEVLAGLSGLAPRNEVETEMAVGFGYASNERLACQTLACEGLIVRALELNMDVD